MSLYNTLGVSRDANPGEIKMAYRRKAKLTHPDKGGDKGEFERVTNAYMILSDPDLRRKYDFTGDESLAAPDNTNGQAMEIIAQVMNSVVASYESNGRDPLTVDIIKEIRAVIKRKMTDFQQAITQIKTLQKNTERFRGRFKVKKGENYFERMVENKIHGLTMNLQAQERQLGIFKHAYDMLKDVKFDFDDTAGITACTLPVWTVTQR